MVMRTLLIVLVGWTGVSLCVVLGYMFGAGVGSRRAWDLGYRQGVADATAHPEIGVHVQTEGALRGDRRVS